MVRRGELVDAVIKAYDIRGEVGSQIDDGLVRDVGTAFAGLMREEGAHRVVIGHDMRESSPGLAAAFADGVTARGLDVTAIGPASTDQLYFASGTLDCPGAMFTASHNPSRYNGIKLCRAGARPVGQDTGLAAIADAVRDPIPITQGPRGVVSTADLLDDYGAFLRTLVDLSGIRPLTVAVDAGNGMAGHTVPAVLGPLPITVEPLYFELDGTFPNHEANPLDPANLVDLQRYVVKTGADIGLAFDGDADRCFVVDERGDPVSPSVVTALVAERELARVRTAPAMSGRSAGSTPGSSGRSAGSTPGGGDTVIIHNLITSRAVPELVRQWGGTPVRTRVGHSFIKARMAETGAVFGGEHSAHYYFRDFWGADSGMLAALHVLAALGGSDIPPSAPGRRHFPTSTSARRHVPLSALTAGYRRYVASGEINSTVADVAGRTAAVVAAFADRAVEVDRLDGVTVDLADGAWFNLRASNTEPLLRLNVEARTRSEVDVLVTTILGIVRD